MAAEERASKRRNHGQWGVPVALGLACAYFFVHQGHYWVGGVVMAVSVLVAVLMYRGFRRQEQS